MKDPSPADRQRHRAQWTPLAAQTRSIKDWTLAAAEQKALRRQWLRISGFGEFSSSE